MKKIVFCLTIIINIFFSHTFAEVNDIELLYLFNETSGYNQTIQEFTSQNEKIAELGLSVSIPQFIGITGEQLQKDLLHKDFDFKHEWSKITNNYNKQQLFTVEPLSPEGERFLLHSSRNRAAPQALDRRPSGLYTIVSQINGCIYIPIDFKTTITF